MVGGGVIGLSSAYHLAEAGVDVTLVERDECGRAASWGNAGWIVPSLVQPFNSPAMVKGAVRAIASRGGPVSIRQIPTVQLLRWGLSFLRASRARQSQASLSALSALARGATQDILDLAAKLDFEIHRKGLLVPFRSASGIEAYQQSHAEVQALGYEGRVEVLDEQAIKAREPSFGDVVVGGLHLLDEVSVRPDSMTSALRQGLLAAGGEIQEHTAVRAVRPDRHGKWRVETSGPDLRADAVVVAAGEATAAVLRSSGVHLSLQSGRGCSVTLPPVVPLRQPVKIAEHRVACTPFDNGEVRFSGTFDLVRPGARTDRARMRSVLHAASTYLPGLEAVDFDELEVWSGPRPCTTDSVPVVGPVGSTPGLFAATGHGTLGMTLAVQTGRSLTRQVSRAVRGASSERTLDT